MAVASLAAAVHGEDALADGIVDDGVGILAGLDLAADRQGLGVEDGHGVGATVADEAAAEFRRKRDAVHTGSVGNVAYHLAAGRIEHDDVGRARDVEAARAGVEGQVVPAALAAQGNFLEEVIAGSGKDRRRGQQQ